MVCEREAGRRVRLAPAGPIVQGCKVAHRRPAVRGQETSSSHRLRLTALPRCQRVETEAIEGERRAWCESYL